MTQECQALLEMVRLIDRITLVAKENGQESGLTAGDRTAYRSAQTCIAKALDHGEAAAKRVVELEAALKDRDDKIAETHTR